MLRSTPADGIPAVLNTPQDFQDAAAQLAAGTGPFAIDTERASSYRYDDRAFLVQIRRRGAGTFLLAPEGLRPELHAALAPVLNDAPWIIHAAPSDLPCLAWLGLYPGTLFDTELASRMAGFAHPNLGGMVEELLGVELEKGYGDSDWSKTPLPHQWLAYAALDVELLIELAEILRDILAEENKLDWAYEEFAAIVDKHAYITAPPEQHWQDLRGIHTLKSPHQLGIAKALWTHRDNIARQRDIAPSRLLPNKVIVEVARQQPRNEQELARVKGFPQRRARAGMAVVKKAGIAKLPRKKKGGVPSRPLWSRDQWGVYQAIRADFAELAAELHMDPETLLKPATLRKAVWSVIGDETVHNTPQLVDVLDEARPWQIDIAVPIIAPRLLG